MFSLKTFVLASDRLLIKNAKFSIDMFSFFGLNELRDKILKNSALFG
jgi:hypothetical protein